MRIDDPERRQDEVRDIAKTSKASIAGWEAAIAKLPRPWFPEERTGTFEAEVPLWGGHVAEVLTTKIVVHRPANLRAGSLVPLVVSSHGSGGVAESAVLAWQRIAERDGLIVIGATEQLKNEGHMGSDHERLTAVSLRRWALLHLPVDPNRVFKTGVSRGGHITWDVTTRFPDLWAGAAPFVGGPRLDPTGGINNLRLVENLVPMSIRDLQGEGDDPGLIFNLKLAFQALDKFGAKDAKLDLQKGHGHSYDPRAVEWDRFFKIQRDAVPERIVFRSVDLRQARCHWLHITKFDPAIVKDAYRPQAKASVWNRLDNNGKKRWVAEDADKHTARVAIHIDRNRNDKANELTLVVDEARGVRSMEALLPRALWPTQDRPKLFVKRGSTRRAATVREDLELWLRDLVDRADPRTAAVVRCPL
ncbi:MAG: hypothetical protein KDC95_09230 [Planctomycetes bacterium]|nr:hypothetical protein [Planctomycetota bacterium]